MAGFSSGEGCFFVNITKSSTNRIGHQVTLLFAITQHSRDRELLERVKDYLGCGDVKESPSRDRILTFKVVRFADNFESIIPFFRQYAIKGVKSEYFNS